MGLTKTYFGYWDQGESYYLYVREASGNKKEANRIYYKGIKHKIREYGWSEVAKIYFKKLVWLWTEGTYQSVYLGMSHSSPGGYTEETAVSRFFEQNLENRGFIKLPMYFGNLISLLAVFIFLAFIILSRKWELINTEMILILILLFFILFYLLWEVKPRYIYPAYPYILLLSFVSTIKLLNYQKERS
jgi:4-amino-4-deoxy-L-arabinose transferase-like glycosyltransferase